MSGIHAISTYDVRYYSTILTANWGGFTFKNHGWIVCDTDESGDRFVITIAPDNEPLHDGATVTVGGAEVGFIAIRRSDLSTFVDILRNEGPVYMQIYTGNFDSFNRIFTGAEPVGEGEVAMP